MGSDLGFRERRAICGVCERPMLVCLCHVIPNPTISVATKLLIIQHPHESRHRLNTARILYKSLLNTEIVVSRRLLPEHLTDDRPTYYLFPSPPTTPVSHLKDHIKEELRAGSVTLIAFDATWKHAKEMVRASEGYLSRFATRVCLNKFDPCIEGGNIYDSELLLRKEPCLGCVSTAEAVARWFGVIEEGTEAESRIIAVLREMVRLQAQFLKPVKPRVR